MGGGGSQTSNQSSTTMPIVPRGIRNLTNASEKDWLSALQAADAGGGLAALLQGHPEAIAQLTSGQLGDINQLQGIAQHGSAGENAAFNQLGQLTGGPIGSSPDTLAAMRAYQQNIAPTIASSVANTGGGRGGAEIAALAQGQTNAYTPLLQQEIANRQASVPLYAQLGQQQSGDLSTALNAGDLQRQIAQSGDTAAFQDFLRRSGLVQQFAQGPAQQFGPLTMGSRSTGTATAGGGQGKF